MSKPRSLGTCKGISDQRSFGIFEQIIPHLRRELPGDRCALRGMSLGLPRGGNTTSDRRRGNNTKIYVMFMLMDWVGKKVGNIRYQHNNSPITPSLSDRMFPLVSIRL